MVMLFIKHISDKYAGVPFAKITTPAFRDMVALKGKPSISDYILGDEVEKDSPSLKPVIEKILTSKS